jgi:hypothetical protein
MIINDTEKSSKGYSNVVALQGRYLDYNAVCNDDKLTLSAMITIQTKLSPLNFYDRRVNHNVTKNKSITTSNTLKF